MSLWLKSRRSLVLFLVLAPLISVAGESQLDDFLKLDRFHYYLRDWSYFIQKKGNVKAAKLARSLSAEDLQRLGLESTELSDPTKFDSVVRKYLLKKDPALKLSAAEAAWGWNFFRNKLFEGFEIKNRKIPIGDVGSQAESHDLKLPKLDPESGLDVDSYISSRTTRGVFWDSAENNIPIEVHVGDMADFKSNIAGRDVAKIEEVKTFARNYNKIFRLTDSKGKMTYAITDVTGLDRAKHLMYQNQLATWHGKKPAMSLVGDPSLLIKEETAKITAQLARLPVADHVIIGQKRLVESMFEDANRALILKDIRKASPQLFADLPKDLVKLFDAAEQPTLASLAALGKGAKKFVEALPAVHKKSFETGGRTTKVELENSSHTMSDLVFQDDAGKTVRWRTFSNTWGDEITPIAEAVRATGHKKVSYIGTAGALPGRGLVVGDVAVPSELVTATGHPQKIDLSATRVPAGAKQVSLTQVASPFEETQSWIKALAPKADAVELEVGYLAKAFKGSNIDFVPLLMISDVVGSEGETLSSAKSSQTRAKLDQVIGDLLENPTVSKVDTALDNLNPRGPVKQSLFADLQKNKNREEIYKNFLMQRYSSSEIDAIEISRKFPPFTASDLEHSIAHSQKDLTHLMDKLFDAGLSPKIFLDSTQFRGDFHPKMEAIKVHLQASVKTADVEKVVKEVNSQRVAKGEHPLEISLSNAPPQSKNLVEANGYSLRSGDALLNRFKNTFIAETGLNPGYTARGKLQFTRFSAPDAPVRCVPGTRACLAFFKPDAKTASVLAEALPKADHSKEHLDWVKKETDSMIRPWRDLGVGFKVDEVKTLPNGSQAEIVPLLDNGKLILNLQFTPEGARNPFVVAEEVGHISQILDYYSVFKSPYHYLEAWTNAQAGSTPSQALLAHAEAQVATLAQDALERLSFKVPGSALSEEVVDKFFEARSSHAQLLLADKVKAGKAHLKKVESEYKKKKSTFDKLETQSQKFDDLVRAGKRTEVRKMLEQYLPLEMMEPFERTLWTEWLEALEHPSKDPKDLTLIYRGLESRDFVGGINAEKKVLMSSVMTRNQGNYSRRLRSLTRARQNGLMAEKDLAGTAPSLMQMFKTHARDPEASLFMSASNMNIANNFANTGGGIGAFLIDKRRVFANHQGFKGFESEAERLIPLVVFPDEIIHFMPGQNFSTDLDDDYVAAIKKKLGPRYQPAYENGFLKDSPLDKMSEDANRSFQRLLSSGECADIYKQFK